VIGQLAAEGEAIQTQDQVVRANIAEDGDGVGREDILNVDESVAHAFLHSPQCSICRPPSG